MSDRQSRWLTPPSGTDRARALRLQITGTGRPAASFAARTAARTGYLPGVGWHGQYPGHHSSEHQTRGTDSHLAPAHHGRAADRRAVLWAADRRAARWVISPDTGQSQRRSGDSRGARLPGRSARFHVAAPVRHQAGRIRHPRRLGPQRTSASCRGHLSCPDRTTETPKGWKRTKMPGRWWCLSGAAYRNRTDDLRITRRIRPVHRRPPSHSWPVRRPPRSARVQARPSPLLADPLARSPKVTRRVCQQGPPRPLAARTAGRP
jgi:hypothetical protein